MLSENYIELSMRSIQVYLLVGAPLILLTFILGILISVLMAATQIQDQTITISVKIIVVVLYFFAGWRMIASMTVDVVKEVFRFADYGF